MEIFERLGRHNYENLIFMNDNESGLKAITCIHNTVLGPAIGGLRIWNYKSEEEMIYDVTRLARGMTYKNAACGIFAGGGKTVMMVDPEKNPKSEAMMRAFGRFLEGMGGRYITAEDVGSNETDMDYIYQETDYVLGTSMKAGTSGNPSPTTAYGVYVGLKATVERKFGSDRLKGHKLVVEGLGNVGFEVARLAREDGAEVYGTDINPKALERAKKAGIQIIDRDKLFEQDADVYVPCALGATLNDESIAKMNYQVVAGSANNQLEDEVRHGEALRDRGILYAPDFIINSAGVIHCHDELYGGFNRERMMKTVDRLATHLRTIYDISEKENITTAMAANKMAEDRINGVLRTRKVFVRDQKSSIHRSL